MTSATSLDQTTDLDALLAPFERGHGPRYRSARWLENEYLDDVWRVNSDTRFQIDWRVPLLDGTVLTARRNRRLLESLRSWPIARTHVDATGGKLFSPRSERNMIQQTLHCIDYLLLRAEPLKIVEHGLSGLSANDLRAMFACIASNWSIYTTIYQWPQNLSSYYRKRISELPERALQKARQICHDIESDIPSEADRLTDLNEDEIVLARCWIALNDAYRAGTNGYRLAPKQRAIVEACYLHTLFGRQVVLPVATELCVGLSYYARTEYPRSRVTSARDERMSASRLRNYVRAMTPLAMLRMEGLDAPDFRPDELSRFIASLDTKGEGRFRTLPQNVVFPALRSAIEYTIDYGGPLVDSYLRLAKDAKDSGMPIGTFAERVGDITAYIPETLRRLGVNKWTIESSGANNPTIDCLSAEEWFTALRSNPGLYESLLVLYGSIHMVVGTLMARRLGELQDLVAFDCLDTSETRLVFRNRKSGIAGLRELEARPIPAIAVRFVKLLERLQAGLIKIGVLKAPTHLFAPPTKYKSSGLAVLSRTQSFRILDLFCDRFETPLDADGNRYYIRQHQLRRFFAMLFFWGGGFGGMDTLRWFLGHTDLQHLWNYITESVPGLTIRTIAAEWAVYGLKHATKEAELLGSELAEYFGTADFSVLDEDAMILHIEDLMEEGRLSIEPEFLDNGRNYRIAVILRPKTPT